MATENDAWANDLPAAAGEPIVVYEDSDIIVLNKPAGLPVHADGKHERATLVDWLVVRYPEIKGVGEEQRLPDGTVIERPGIVHRIDAQTSGVLVVARTQQAFDYLKESATQVSDQMSASLNVTRCAPCLRKAKKSTASATATTTPNVSHIGRYYTG